MGQWKLHIAAYRQFIIGVTFPSKTKEIFVHVGPFDIYCGFEKEATGIKIFNWSKTTNTKWKKS